MTSEPLHLRTIPTPTPGPGSAIIRVLAVPILTYAREIYNGSRNYPYPTPLVPGASAIGRVVAVGNDAVMLRAGDLVYADCCVRGRDDRDTIFLGGLHQGFTDSSHKLMGGEFRDFTFAEYARVPLEVCSRLDEGRLLGSPERGGLGLTVEDLTWMMGLSVPFGGLTDINLKTGERVIIAPATGGFGGSAVKVALAMGAFVVAMGRDQEALKKLKALNPEKVDTVQMTGDMETDIAALKQFGPVDAYYDVSPAAAINSTHIRSCIQALAYGGRVSFMGGIKGDVLVPYTFIMHFDISLKGKWMLAPKDAGRLIRLIEGGILTLGEKGGSRVVATYGLKDWKEAFDTAAAANRVGDLTVFKP
ncbi:MAG: hypothetical protein OHK93_003792 [Ramalina farinacea]|uniref:Alcohol dehydrogenase n=1 Tax=Ramalina farinacea TaxID=258253 RepID=A0AA43QX64_9LECA|nr:hypothetical protein [Ramalina farinacea]